MREKKRERGVGNREARRALDVGGEGVGGVEEGVGEEGGSERS